MDKRVGIANRGEIAIRIAATCRRLGATPILLAGMPDQASMAARTIGVLELTGPAGSEVDVAAVITAAKRARADLLHPGYGFLSERADLAEACASAGILFVGPTPQTLRFCGDKLQTRAAAERAGAPVLPASPPLSSDPQDWLVAAETVGYPLLVKPAGAGGGRGLRFCASEAELVTSVEASLREIASGGVSATIYLERALIAPRHIEVQVAADGAQTIAVGDRDCSIQRRHQKVIEEAPAPNVPDDVRAALHHHARNIAIEVQLKGIATCEFLLGASGEIAFLEVNPRIQVEHPVTEETAGIDLVEWQLRIATGEQFLVEVAAEPMGHAIEARIYAEDPDHGFLPTPGRLGTVSWSRRPGIRIDAGYESGDIVPSEYDSMIAKVIARGTNRDAALAELRLALLDAIVAGRPTNIPWLVNLVDDNDVRIGLASTETVAHVQMTLPDRGPALLAAACYLLEQPRVGMRDAWQAIGPWNPAGRTEVRFCGDDWEEMLTIEPDRGGVRLRAAPDRADARAWRNPDGTFGVVWEANLSRFAISVNGDEFEVAGGGGRWLIMLGSRPVIATKNSTRATDGIVRSPLPATVVAIHALPGQRVSQGQPIVTVYAMKMELACNTNQAGEVRSIECAVGDLVDHDQVLARIDGVPESTEP